MRSRWIVLLVAALLSLFAAACGGDDEGGGGGGAAAGGEEQSEAVANAEEAPPVPEEPPQGEVTFCLGKDTSGNQRAAAKEFNEMYGDQGLRMRLLEFPESADEQRNQFVQRQEAQSPDCDIFYSDVIWTAEFASQGWLLDTTDYVNKRRDEFIPSTLETIQYQNKYFGVPQQTDAAFLYYRTDQVDEVPPTWQEVYEIAQQEDGIVYQGAPYEGLTVVFLELAFAAGGEVLSEDGSECLLDSPANLEALQFMVDGIEDNAAPRAVTTYMEEQARRSFENGNRTFMRNWPYAYALGNQAPKVKGKFAVAPFPAFEGGGKAGILGGHNLVISSFSENPEAAMFAVDYLTSPKVIERNASEFSLAPVLRETYNSEAVQEALPFADELLQAVEQAKTRPVSPVYPQISAAIYKNVNRALSGQATPDDALQQAQQECSAALETF